MQAKKAKLGQNVHQKFNARQNELRLFIMNYIVTEGHTFNLDADAQKAMDALSMSREEYDGIVKVLLERDGMVIDGDTRDVNFIYPVSALETRHHVKLADGRSFCAMCAIDAIGSTFTFHQDTVVDSVCTDDDSVPVHIEMKDGKVASYSPEGLYALSFQLEELSNWAGSC